MRARMNWDELPSFVANQMATLLLSSAFAFAPPPCLRRKSPQYPLSVSVSASASTIASASASASSSVLFFARVNAQAPLAVVAVSVARWLDLYSGVLTLRVLLSWLPNLPWHRQPLAALRDLCDPYLAFFRRLIPPLFGTLDLSPLLAFALLSALSSLLNANAPFLSA